MTRWSHDEPGRPPRILTEPQPEEPLEEVDAWSNAALSSIATSGRTTCLLCGGCSLASFDPDCTHVTRESIREGLRPHIKAVDGMLIETGGNEDGWGAFDRREDVPHGMTHTTEQYASRRKAFHPTREGAIGLVLDELVAREVERLRPEGQLYELPRNSGPCSGWVTIEGGTTRTYADGRITLSYIEGATYSRGTEEYPSSAIRTSDPHPQTFKVGDVVVLKCDPEQEPKAIASIQRNGEILREGQSAACSRRSYRPATPEERATYLAAQGEDEELCPREGCISSAGHRSPCHDGTANLAAQEPECGGDSQGCYRDEHHPTCAVYQATAPRPFTVGDVVACNGTGYLYEVTEVGDGGCVCLTSYRDERTPGTFDPSLVSHVTEDEAFAYATAAHRAQVREDESAHPPIACPACEDPSPHHAYYHTCGRENLAPETGTINGKTFKAGDRITMGDIQRAHAANLADDKGEGGTLRVTLADVTSYIAYCDEDMAGVSLEDGRRLLLTRLRWEDLQRGGIVPKAHEVRQGG